MGDARDGGRGGKVVGRGGGRKSGELRTLQAAALGLPAPCSRPALAAPASLDRMLQRAAPSPAVAGGAATAAAADTLPPDRCCCRHGSARTLHM